MFNRNNLRARPNMTGFGGWAVGGEGVISREGKTAYVIAYDFGGLRTNASGDGFAQFDLTVPPGTYDLQYTVRIGAVNTCRTSQGITHGCAVAYRSGNRFGERMETIRIPSSYSQTGQQPPPAGQQTLDDFFNRARGIFK